MSRMDGHGPSGATVDVVGIGCVSLDTVLVVETDDWCSTPKTPVRSRELRLGGLTGVALAAAARFGASTSFAGLLGEDQASFVAEQFLQGAGVGTGARYAELRRLSWRPR